MRRGQLTMLVLLGLVIIIAFGFVFYLRGAIVEEQLNTEADKAIQGYIQSAAIATYVDTCINKIAEDGMFILGMQGGVIYEDQGGIIPITEEEHLLVSSEEPTEDGRNTTKQRKVHYGIKRPTNQDCSETTIPNYPFTKTYLIELYGKYTTNLGNNPNCDLEENFLGGALGKHNLPPLCDPTGPNAIGTSSIQAFPCKIGSYGENSVQEQLTKYIETKLDECAEFKFFEERTGNTIEQTGNPTVEILLGPKEFIITSTYPFTVSFQGGQPITKLVSFTTIKQGRLKEIYEHATRILSSEARNVYFGEENYELLRIEQRPKVYKIENICEGCSASAQHDDLLIVIDEETTIRGVPWKFQTGIQNRNPALNYLHFPQGNIEPRHYDLVILEGLPIRLEPEGHDPDEDGAVNEEYRMEGPYKYEGWKATYEQNNVFGEEWKWTKVEKDGTEVTIPLPINVKEYNELQQIEYGKEQFITCKHEDPGCDGFNVWEGSSPYTSPDTETKDRVAEYITGEKDIGPHEVKITITEESGRKDYQLIRILVADLCAQGRKFFTEYDSSSASVEDPYILESCSLTPFEDWIYEWTDELEGLLGEVASLTLNKEILDPLGTGPFTVVGPRTVTLQIEDPEKQQTSTVNLDVEVYDCLDHENPGTAPYPYNTYLDDDYNVNAEDFLASHICCEDNQLQPGKTCYELNQWSRFRTEILQGTDVPPADISVQDQGNKIIAHEPVNTNLNRQGQSDYELENDIFTRNYEQKCGERGNACSGNVNDQWNIADSCKDLEPIRGTPIGRCEGPPRTTNYELPENTECNLYTGETYESIFEGANTKCALPETGGTCVDKNDYTSSGIYKTTEGATCNKGSCTEPINPECAQECGAQCDSNTPPQWNGYSCRTNCNTDNDCSLQQYWTPCPSTDSDGICISTTERDSNDNEGVILKDYCYYATQCINSGVYFLRRVYTMSRCPEAGTNIGNICYYGTRTCGTSGSQLGVCQLTQENKNEPTVPENWRNYFTVFGPVCQHNCELFCHETSGWSVDWNSCINEFARDFNNPSCPGANPICTENGPICP